MSIIKTISGVITSSNAIDFDIQNSTVMTIDDGKVGFLNSTGSVDDVGVHFLKAVGTVVKIETTATNANPDVLIVDTDNNSVRASLQIQGNGGTIESLFVASNGNVGIGTTNPGAELHLEKTDGDARFWIGESSTIRGQIDWSYSGNALEMLTYAHDYPIKIGPVTVGGLFIDTDTNSGNVGIGTNGPSASLHISKGNSIVNTLGAETTVVIEDDTNAGLAIITPNSSQGYITFGDPEDSNIGYVKYNHSTNSMIFRTNANDRMTIDSTGNVGIGITNPANKLVIVTDTNADALVVSSSNDTFVDFVMDSNRDGGSEGLNNIRSKWNNNEVSRIEFRSGVNASTKDDGEIAFYTRESGSALTRVVTIADDGKVGIGTTDPTENLVVRGATPTFRIDDTTASSAWSDKTLGDIDFFTEDISGGGPDVVGRIRSVGAIGGSTTCLGSLAFWTGAPGAVAEAVRIDNNGNVGIGTTLPTAKLHTWGTISGSNLDISGTSTFAGVISGSGDLFIDGNIRASGFKAAMVKTPEGQQLTQVALEGNEIGIYFRGESDTNVIECPDYWKWLVDSDSITAQITPVEFSQQLYVSKVKDYKIYIKRKGFKKKLHYYYNIYGVRKDINKLEVQ